ncbi:peptidoglycan D,D-transpeptidase FtsI family protein [Candidatus Clavichlamydia salmonicola]|uniref:peptidoglycan D,D-transpeptidase FtsI family protein n=1 Tax=Candidatus Clavichlamydia salmonicola TaxID=469812 RepID=UPI001891059E|nr:penicillin-binding protein 2 [Candidatus Clavichlamydia salmonicola]
MTCKKRILVVASFIFVLFSFLVARYFHLQVVQGARWTREANLQHEFIVKEPFKRGSFYSNMSIQKGHQDDLCPLVYDLTNFHLYVDPVAVPQICQQEISAVLADLLSSDAQIIQKEFLKISRSRCLMRKLDSTRKDHILKWWQSYARQHKIAPNALYFVKDYHRSYPYGKLLGQVLHTIRDDKDEVSLEAFPTGGLESYFNHVLDGKVGKRKLLRSPLNRMDIDRVIEEPRNGADVYLSVNHCLQSIIEEELEKGVERTGAQGAMALMMDPYTGEILAIGQYPFFNPTSYRSYFNDPLKVEQTKSKPIVEAFEFASIMKPMTVTLALMANKELENLGQPAIFDPEAKMDVTRSIFPGRTRFPLKDIFPSRALNMNMAIQKSSNVYMAQLADLIVRHMGFNWYHDTLQSVFGLGVKTGIEMPGEAKGFIPTPNKKYPGGLYQWSLSTPYSLAMGYNMMATMLQVVRAYSVIVNGGFLVNPTFVKKIMLTENNTNKRTLLTKVLDEKIMSSVVDKHVVRQVYKALRYTTQPGGSGILASLSHYTSGGKTGTAEKIVGRHYCKKSHMASFVGFAPASQDPSIKSRFVLMVTVDDPAYTMVEGRKNYMGGRAAAPIFKCIAERALEYMGEPKQKEVFKEEAQALKFLYELWNQK